MARKFWAGAIAASLLSTTAAQALTADAVWAAWQKQYASYGFTVVTGEQSRAGDTLSLRDVQLSSKTGQDELQLAVPEVRLREQGDGTVEVTLSREITGTSRSAPPAGEPMEMALHVTQTDAKAVVSGTEDQMVYHLTAPVAVMDMQQVLPPTTEGATDLSKAAPMAMQVTASGIEGNYRLGSAAGQQIDSDFTVKSVQMTLDSPNAGDGTSLKMRGDLADLASHSNTFTPEGTSVEDLGAALAKGARASGSAKYGVSTWMVETTGEKGVTTLNGSAESGDLNMVLAPDAFRYGGTSTAAKVKVQMPGMPMPFSADLAAAQFDVSLPMRKSDTPEPFLGKLNLSELRLSDEVWGLFDPEAKLPRTPATLTLDIGGTAHPLLDLFSPEAAQQQGLPLRFDTVTLNKLQLIAAGADLSGAGAVSFDNAAEPPMPEGSVDLRLAGANGLMDNLAALKLVPQDQMMFVRMMLGLYAVPAGDDLYTSKIEFKSGGEILANGQRIR